MAINIVDRTALDAALTSTANAIRTKTGGSATLEFDMTNGNGFKNAVDSIPAPKQEQSKTLTLGASTPTTVTPDSGKVLSSVPVTLDASVIKAENIKKDVTILGITGTHEGGTTPVLVTKTITQNGAYNASDDNADGYSEVTVAVSGGGGATVVETENEFGGITLTITE